MKLTSLLRPLTFVAIAMAFAATACEDELPPRPSPPDAMTPLPTGSGSPDAGTQDAAASDLPVGDARDTSGDIADAGDANDVAAEASPGDAEGREPLYVVAGTVFGTPPVSYVVTTRSLAAGTKVAYEGGLPLFGGAVIFGTERAGHFFVGSGETPVLTRWEVSPDGDFRKGASMSLAAHGFSNTLTNEGGAVFLSPTKAYFIHQEDLKAIVWNPTTMEITGTLSLPAELKRDGFLLVLDGKARRRGNDLYLVASWADHTNGKYPAGSLLVTIDVTTNAVVAKEVDPRCGQLFDSVVLGNGDIYYGSTSWVAATNRVLGDGFGGEPCILRLANGQRRFDPAFQIRLRPLFGSAAGALVAGGGTNVFVRALDETLVKIAADSTPGDVAGAEAWRWWRLDLATMATTKIDSLAPSAAGGTEFTVDGRVFTSVSKKDFSETTLVEMTTAGGPQPGMVLRGYAERAIRVH
ncbi:MAG TPA: hypothetical protein VGF45_17305 [Polyangia bacterium]